jgi:Tfp pilus assembly protein PilN
MSRGLNPREKKLLVACLLAVFGVGTAFAWGSFSKKRKALKNEIENLAQQRNDNNALLERRDFWVKRMKWLDSKMPYTDSALRSQGQLLDELQASTLDAELKITGQTLLDSVQLDYCNEVALNIKVRGDQDRLLRWLLMLQSTESFQVIKSIELELDAKAKEKTPQAQCNLTIARWFNKTPPADAAPPAPHPAVTDTLANPLASPLDPVAPPLGAP